MFENDPMTIVDTSCRFSRRPRMSQVPA